MQSTLPKRLNHLMNLSMALMPGLDSHKLKAYHFSFVIHKNRIVSIGSNTDKTHTEAYKLKYLYPSIHSELDAYIRAKRVLSNLEDCNLVNIRLSRLSLRKKSPILRMSRPCKYCLPWCQNIFKNIVYSTDEGFERIS